MKATTTIAGVGLSACALPTNVLTFVSTYATAAHLALLTVAPLFLFPFCGEEVIATVLLWLSLLGAVWIVMSPSVKGDERPHDARSRFVREVVRDPLFWASLVLVVFAGVRSLNGGVAFAYDAETYSWGLSGPSVAIFPGCVSGAGFLPFSMCVALLVLLQGFRHALDRRAVVGYLVSASVLAGFSAIVAIAAISYDSKSVLSLVECSYLSPSFIGTAYGIHLLCAVSALFCCVEEKMVAAELMTVVSMVAVSVGLVMFSPVLTFSVFALAWLLVTVLSFSMHRRAVSGAGSLRCALAVALVAAAAVAPFLLFDKTSALADRRDAILAAKFLPDGFMAARAALSDIALKVWKANPWLGSGLGSFLLDIKFFATPENWAVISPLQNSATFGWWQLLAERGILGLLAITIVCGFLAFTFVRRVVSSFSSRGFRSVHVLGPLVFAVLSALAFFDCSFLRVDVLLTGAAVMALSSAALPEAGGAKSSAKEVK